MRARDGVRSVMTACPVGGLKGNVWSRGIAAIMGILVSGAHVVFGRCMQPVSRNSFFKRR